MIRNFLKVNKIHGENVSRGLRCRSMESSRCWSAQLLAEVLADRKGPIALAIRKEIHRTLLWAYVKGKKVPSGHTIGRLHELSEGRVPADGWQRRS